MRKFENNSSSSNNNYYKSGHGYASHFGKSLSLQYPITTVRETSPVNVDVTGKSTNDEEWQESLENWREKRRQLVSSVSLDDSKQGGGVNYQLMELKERARKMKLLRDQMKDQMMTDCATEGGQPTNVDSNILPDIDEETRALIERVRQKKLNDEQIRKCHTSPSMLRTFSSNPDLTKPAWTDPHREEKVDTTKDNESNTRPMHTSVTVLGNVHDNEAIDPHSNEIKEASRSSMNIRVGNDNWLGRFNLKDDVKRVLPSKFKIDHAGKESIINSQRKKDDKDKNNVQIDSNFRNNLNKLLEKEITYRQASLDASNNTRVPRTNNGNNDIIPSKGTITTGTKSTFQGSTINQRLRERQCRRKYQK